VSSDLLEALDLERHVRSLRRASGGPSVAVCAREGKLVSSWAGAGTGPIGPVLDEVGEAAHGWAVPREAVRELDLGSGRRLVQAPLFASAQDPVGWLSALLEASEADVDAAGVHAELRDAAESMSAELRLREEIGGMVAELSARYEELNLVYEFAPRVQSFDGDASGARTLLASFADHLDVAVAALVLAGRPEPIVALGRRSPLADLDLLLTQLRGELFRFVAVSRSPLLINVPDDPLRAYLLVNLPYHVMACPVVEGGETLAMLALARDADGPDFSNSDRNLATMVAGQLAVLMRNRVMRDSLERFSADMAAALVEAMEAKDPYTRGHSERVQAISIDIGRAADLAGRDVEDISWGALLHDVGKIGVPDSVLCKRGALSADEYTLIKIHPERSYEILRHIDGLGENALAAARYHQERFDGAGYPHGLRGAGIPVHARVVSVADTYDAITSSRAYRPARDHRVALDRIRQAAGSQLDPHFVAILEKLCAESPGWLAATREPEPDADDG
jgi:HD-GYP domain-containing protein (c-di-GMP phosphodiesterase class II)